MLAIMKPGLNYVVHGYVVLLYHLSQAKPKASIYWKSDPDFEQFEQKDEVIQTNKTFTTISKVRKSYSQNSFSFSPKFYSRQLLKPVEN